MVFDLSSNDRFVLTGPAGAGKTSKLIQCMRLHPLEMFLVVMYNRKIKDAVTKRTQADANIQVATLDSICFKLAFGTNTQTPDPSDEQVHRCLFDSAWGDATTRRMVEATVALIPDSSVKRSSSRTHESQVRSEVIQMIGEYIVTYHVEGFADSELSLQARRMEKQQSWRRAWERRGHGCERRAFNELNKLSVAMRAPLLSLISGRRAWSYCTLRWYCAYNGLGARLCDTYGISVVAVDEAQDLNHWLHEIVKQAGVTRILIGDPHQAIFKFLSATTNALLDTDGATKHHLSTVFRYGQNVCDLLCERYGIESYAHSSAPDTVITGADTTAVITSAFPYVHLVRTWKSIAQLISNCIHKSVQFCCVPPPADDDSSALETLANKLIDTGVFAEDSLSLRLALRPHFCERADDAQVTISTVHAFKGVEADTVAVHADMFRCNDKDLQNVALTRARRLLLLPPRLCPDWRKKRQKLMQK